MPREQINHPTAAVIVDHINEHGVPIHKPPQQAPALHIGWQAGTHVQLAFEADTEYFRALELDTSRTTVWTEPLSRDDINRLIKVLRRARDAAHGRDE